jgi:hypothetical protein
MGQAKKADVLFWANGTIMLSPSGLIEAVLDRILFRGVDVAVTEQVTKLIRQSSGDNFITRDRVSIHANLEDTHEIDELAKFPTNKPWCSLYSIYISRSFFKRLNKQRRIALLVDFARLSLQHYQLGYRSKRKLLSMLDGESDDLREFVHACLNVEKDKRVEFDFELSFASDDLTKKEEQQLRHQIQDELHDYLKDNKLGRGVEGGQGGSGSFEIFFWVDQVKGTKQRMLNFLEERGFPKPKHLRRA